MMNNNSLAPHTKILTPLAENGGVGMWLRYDPTYIKIRNAKREENDGMPRESWEAEIKNADWQEVETLTLEALENKSKDLQLVCWLIEARLHLYGLDTFTEDIDLLLAFVKTFWDTCYPPKEEGDEDQEFRIHILEAFLRNTSRTIITQPFKDLAPILGVITLAQCYESDNAERMSKKGGDAANFYQNALANGLITINRIRNAFSEVKKEIGEEKISTIEICTKKLKDINDLVDEKTKGNSPDFNKLIAHLQEIKSLYTLCEKSPPPQEEAPPQIDPPKEKSEDKGKTIINNRSEVYLAIRQLGDFLQTLEPHSPSPALLRLIGSWEDKTLPQILGELQSTQPEIRSLLELLARAAHQNYHTQSQPKSTDTSALSNPTHEQSL